MFTRVVIRTSRNQGILSLFRYSNYSSSVSPEPKNTATDDIERLPQINKEPFSKKRHGMVAAAFASLNAEANHAEIKTPFSDKQITEADTVDSLLKVCEGSGVSRRYALKVVSILAEWSSTGKVALTDFESDPRFIKLCKVLTKGSPTHRNARTIESRNDDLSTILSVTADDEAAKLVGSITLPQMVKIMSTLSAKKRRSTLLLRALSYNITKSTQQLDLKQSGDLLYSMANLNFFDENLLSKVANDICLQLETNINKSSVIGSILTSLGFLRYKHPDLLDSLCDWIINNYSNCRPQDVFRLCMTLAVVNYLPINADKLFQVLLPQLSPSEAGKPSVWLEVVWSLMLMNRANSEHISSILDGNYLEKLEEPSFSIKLKLLNIDAAAQYLLKDYKGPRIPPNSYIRKTEILVSKEKSEMVDSVVNSLKNLIQSDNLLQTGINTGMGFSIDAVCCFDKKFHPHPLDVNTSSGNYVRVAILTQCYHDMCRGRLESTGISNLAINLLEAQGYKVLTIPYTDFKVTDKLIQRVQYLESKLKQLVKS